MGGDRQGGHPEEIPVGDGLQQAVIYEKFRHFYIK